MKKLIFLLCFFTIESFAQSKCYLDYHMKNSFSCKVFCWGSDTQKFLDTLSVEAKNYLDSVFNKFGADPKSVVCEKIKLHDSSPLICNENVDKSKYFYTAFERTFDCFDNSTYQNFRGKVKINKKTKIILEYLMGVKKDYELLRIYIINDKKKKIFT